MKFDKSFKRMLGFFLLGLGIFQISAAVIGFVFWLFTRTWQPFTPIIMILAVVTTWFIVDQLRDRIWKETA